MSVYIATVSLGLRIFSTEDNPHSILAVNLRRGQVIGLDLHAQQVVWKKEFPHPLGDAVADTVEGICFVSVPCTQSVIALDFQGKMRGHWRVAFVPRSIVPVLTPSVARPEREMMPYLLCVLASSGKAIALLRTAGPTKRKLLRFPAPVHSLAGHAQAAYLSILSAGKVTVVNPNTMEVTRVLPIGSSAQTLRLTADSQLLLSLSSTLWQ